MGDKTFELIEKIYGELVAFRNETNKRFEGVDKRLGRLESNISGLKKDVLRLENDLKPKVEAALDGYKVVYEKLQEHDKRFEAIEQKLDKQDVEIRVIKGAK